jgi:hypothetical protein
LDCKASTRESDFSEASALAKASEGKKRNHRDSILATEIAALLDGAVCTKSVILATKETMASLVEMPSEIFLSWSTMTLKAPCCPAERVIV